jgi:uncharacterized membrane protein
MTDGMLFSVIIFTALALWILFMCWLILIKDGKEYLDEEV